MENFVNIECHITKIKFKNSSCLRHTCPAINSGIFYHHYVSANVCVSSTWQNLLVSSPTPPFSDTSWHHTWPPGKNNHSPFGDYLIPYPDSTHLNLINLFILLLNQKIFFDHLLCKRCWCWGNKALNNTETILFSWSLHTRGDDIIIKQNHKYIPRLVISAKNKNNLGQEGKERWKKSNKIVVHPAKSPPKTTC